MIFYSLLPAHVLLAGRDQGRGEDYLSQVLNWLEGLPPGVDCEAELTEFMERFRQDLINVEGVRTTFGSHTMADNVAEAHAPSVERVRAAGACIIGKSTTTEFGCKAGGGDSPLSGVTRNAWDTSKTPGGSSVSLTVR